MENPQYEVLSRGEDESVHTGRVVPIYQRVADLSPRMVRTVMHNVFKALPGPLPEPLPSAMMERRGLMPRLEALRMVHFPPEEADLDQYQSRGSEAHRRLIFEEFFLLQLALGMRRESRLRSSRAPFDTSPEIRGKLQSILPFHLTSAQKRAFREIVEDMTAGSPMNRLLQGDVGSGKTIVALLAMLLSVENGRQAALMAPTELLAEQHFRVMSRLLSGHSYRLHLLTGTLTAAQRRPLLRGLEDGYIQMLVGTHALIQGGVVFKDLGLVVIDEQHRFGVAQRAALRGKGDSGAGPDVLVMTATPIPRSLALTVYGDLDLSVIDELPPGRKPIRTHVRPESSRARILDFLRRQVAEGRQVYVVLPLVEESEKSDLKAAVEMARELREGALAGLPIGLVHGRMKPEERDDVMRRFASGEISVLVSTTVIEVGIDVPNATTMLVEHAERFGLSQLHQLRGRVGRGEHESHCILVHSDEITDEAARRLEVMKESSDGFTISEKDLEIRGPGEFLGTRQSGLPEIRIGNIIRDFAVLEDARKEAAGVLERLRSARGEADPELEELTRHMGRHWGARIDLMDIG